MITRIDAIAMSSKTSSYFAVSAHPAIGQIDRGGHDHHDQQQLEPRRLGTQADRLEEGVEVEHAAERSRGREADVAEQQAEPCGVGESGPESVAGVGAQRARRHGALGLEADGRRDQHGDRPARPARPTPHPCPPRRTARTARLRPRRWARRRPGPGRIRPRARVRHVPARCPRPTSASGRESDTATESVERTGAAMIAAFRTCAITAVCA